MISKEEQIRLALKTGFPVQQVAALPWRVRPADSRLRQQREILLVTSRRRRRLILPKGWPMPHRSWLEAAEIEALEEAGVCGRIEPNPVGSYRTSKRIGAAEVPVLVTVFPLRVERLLSKWKEAAQRRRLWVPADAAVRLVNDTGLSGLLARVS